MQPHLSSQRHPDRTGQGRLPPVVTTSVEQATLSAGRSVSNPAYGHNHYAGDAAVNNARGHFYPSQQGYTTVVQPVTQNGSQPGAELASLNLASAPRSFNPAPGMTALATRPVDRVTDPTLLQQGVRAQRMLMGDAGETEALYSNFKTRPPSFFKFGRVFLVPWSEPAPGASGDAAISVSDPARGLLRGRYGEYVFSKLRRFVVVRASAFHCSAVPITVYGHQGVAKRGVVKSEHAIIYTGHAPPSPRPDELPGRGEMPMHVHAIRVVPDNPSDKLDPLSRVNLGQIYTIQHNIKVRPLGMVETDSEPLLLRQLQTVWASMMHPARRLPASTSSSRAGSIAPSSPVVQASGRPQLEATPATTTNRNAVRGNRDEGQRVVEDDEEEESDEGEDDDDDEGEEEEEEGEDDDAGAGVERPIVVSPGQSQRDRRSAAARLEDREKALRTSRDFHRLLSTEPPHTPARAFEEMVAATRERYDFLDQKSATTLVRNQLQYARSIGA